MGLPLSQPVMTEIREKNGNEIFRCGSNCVNGYRDAMEDAHLVYLQPTWGFFGVFDGHINDQCSSYLESAWGKALDVEREKNGIPMSDDRMKEIALQIDAEWLESGRDGGSTGTFFLAIKEGNNVHLQVGNVGDSRVVASINGECCPLTEDHKPGIPEEHHRIERCGGRVENNRVDGSLAVSRAFGDHEYKKNASGAQEQKVIALPDVKHANVTFNSQDFVVLCCDGVFEGTFSNEEVIAFVQEKLKTSNDLPEIAGLVCQEAIIRGSRDNISCVIVQFTNGLDYNITPSIEVIPGSFSLPENANFRRAYKSMAEKGHSSIEKVLEKRYDILQKKKQSNTIIPEEIKELEVFDQGPGSDLAADERTEFFKTIFDSKGANSSKGGDGMGDFEMNGQSLPIPLLISLLKGQSDFGERNSGDGLGEDGE